MDLEPRADRVVRDAVDAFMEGRLVPDFSGEIVFETKNSRYRLRDGVVFAAPDASLIGAELVGWLCESSRRCLVESAWQPGSRAVLVDRKRGRNIIVTSTTRLLHLEEHGSPSYMAGSVPPPTDFRSWHPPPLDQPDAGPRAGVEGSRSAKSPFSPQHAPIIPSTPAPSSVLLAPLPPPASEPPPPSPIAPAAPAKRGVHLPPRPIARGQVVLRPLPVPVPPPRRGSSSPPVIPPEPPAWEITSAEMEIVDTAEPETLDRPDEPMIPFDLARPLARENEPVNSEPFPLVRPIDPSGTSGSR